MIWTLLFCCLHGLLFSSEANPLNTAKLQCENGKTTKAIWDFNPIKGQGTSFGWTAYSFISKVAGTTARTDYVLSSGESFRLVSLVMRLQRVGQLNVRFMQLNSSAILEEKVFTDPRSTFTLPLTDSTIKMDRLAVIASPKNAEGRVGIQFLQIKACVGGESKMLDRAYCNDNQEEEKADDNCCVV